jgi:indoleamine 2,3-dioxygenase
VDKTGPIELDNLATLQLFLGGMDEQWFYVTAVVIEAKGAPALGALVAAQQAVAAGRAGDLATHLEAIASALAGVYDVLDRIPEKCDPYIFYHRVRPYQTGWPEPGVIYEGVSDVPRMCAGGSAAQSPLIQALDAGLGVKHRDSETSTFLMEMRSYMVAGHRRFIEVLEAGPSIRQFVLDRAAQCPALGDRYNACIREVDRFRKKHMELAVRYISHQAPNPDEAKGTGGTNFVSFLSKARKETGEHTIRE